MENLFVKGFVHCHCTKNKTFLSKVLCIATVQKNKTFLSKVLSIISTMQTIATELFCQKLCTLPTSNNKTFCQGFEGPLVKGLGPSNLSPLGGFASSFVSQLCELFALILTIFHQGPNLNKQVLGFCQAHRLLLFHQQCFQHIDLGTHLV